MRFVHRRRCNGDTAAAATLLRWGTVALSCWTAPCAVAMSTDSWHQPCAMLSAVVSCALCAGDAAGATTLQRRADAAAVHQWLLRLHSTFVHSGNDSRPLMSSNVHREYTGCAQVVLHQQGATERVQTERLQLRDETALQLRDETGEGGWYIVSGQLRIVNGCSYTNLN